MTFRKLLALALFAACSPRYHRFSLATIQPTEARTVSDSIVAMVLLGAVTPGGLRGLQTDQPVIVQMDSAFLSSSALPRTDSVQFAFVDSTQAEQLANERGRLTVVSIARPIISGDTARSAYTARTIRGREKVGGMAEWLTCFYRFRRIDGAWHVDSALGCVVT